MPQPDPRGLAAAVERLRRIEAGDSPRDVYGEPPKDFFRVADASELLVAWWNHKTTQDRETLANAYLARLAAEQDQCPCMMPDHEPGKPLECTAEQLRFLIENLAFRSDADAWLIVQLAERLLAYLARWPTNENGGK